jgi:hypothetical protein
VFDALLSGLAGGGNTGTGTLRGMVFKTFFMCLMQHFLVWQGKRAELAVVNAKNISCRHGCTFEFID